MIAMDPEKIERIRATLQAADSLLSECRPLVEALARSYAYISPSGDWLCIHCRAKATDLPAAGKTLEDVFVHREYCPVPAAQAMLTREPEL